MSNDSEYCANCGKMYSRANTMSTTGKEEQVTNESENDVAVEYSAKSITKRTTWVLIGVGDAIAITAGGIFYSCFVNEHGYYDDSPTYTEPAPAQSTSQTIVSRKHNFGRRVLHILLILDSTQCSQCQADWYCRCYRRYNSTCCILSWLTSDA